VSAVRRPRAQWRVATLGQLSSYDEGEVRMLAGYDGPARPTTLEAFWAEHARHGVVYRRDDTTGEVALVECEECYGAALYLNAFAAIIDGLFFDVREEE
jgi:hypothetical protein